MEHNEQQIKSHLLKMERNFWVLSFAIAIFFFTNCSQPQKQTEAEDGGIPVIEIMANISNAQKVNLSTVASSIEYCMLELNKECPIARKEGIYSSGDCFVAISNSQSSNYCYVFDRKTGNFVRHISQRGQGPDDYQRALRVLSGHKGQIFMLGNHQYLFYNLDGTLSHKASVNKFEPCDSRSIVAYEDIYVGYVINKRGNATIRIAFFDKSGELIDSIPNYRFHDDRPKPNGIDFSFHQFNNNLYYKDIYCDTLYQIKNVMLQPRYIFNTGGRAVPYELQLDRVDLREAMAGRDWDKFAKYIVINNKILEDANFLYFTFDYKRMMYPAIYHKSEDKTQILMPESLPQHPFGSISLYGFENDLDGGLPFWP